MAAQDASFVEAFREASDSCPIPEAVQIIGERWTCLIIRAAMLGVRHFEEFQACLGIARNILSDRLGRLVAAGVLARNADPDDGRKVIYALTANGAALMPVFFALRQWAMDAGLGKPGHLMLADRHSGRPVSRLAIQAQDGRALAIDEVMWVDPDGKEFVLPGGAANRRVAA